MLHTLQDAPGDYRAWWMAGQLAFQRSEDAEGAAAIRSAVRLYDGDPNLLVDAAALELSAGRYAEAESLTRRALALVPGFSTARNRRILSLLGLGRCAGGGAPRGTLWRPDVAEQSRLRCQCSREAGSGL